MARTRKRPQGTPDVASAEGGGLAQHSSPEPRVAPAGDLPDASRATAPASRPVYSQFEREELHTQVCALIEQGASTRAACEEVGVSRQAWWEWVSSNTVDADQYARAREANAAWHAEGIVEEAERLGRIDPAYAKVVVDAKKWVASRLHPRMWGDKLDVTSNGKEVSPIVALPAVTLIQQAASADKLAQAETAEVLGIVELPRLASGE